MPTTALPLARRLAIGWLACLAIVVSALAPGLHALAQGRNGGFDPSQELCSALGLVSGNGQPQGPADGAAHAKHCSQCVVHTAAAPPPADAPLLPGTATAPDWQPPADSSPLRAAAERYAAPRGPPLRG